MLISSLISVVLLGQAADAAGQSRKTAEPRVQLPPSEFRGEPDATRKRQILEAYRQAQMWVFWQSNQYYPSGVGLGLTTYKQKTHWRLTRTAFEHHLRMAAYKQICEAYDITPKELEKIVFDPRSSIAPFEPEHLPRGDGTGGIRMLLPGQPDILRPTRFDPEKVKLSDKLVKKYGYQNPGTIPKPIAQPKRFMSDDEYQRALNAARRQPDRTYPAKSD